MCFAPYISLSTFIIEFILAAYFLWRGPKDKLNRIIALLSFLLGVYQLNEFLICTTGLTLFTKLAMITTSILPAIGISYALIMTRRKLPVYLHMLIYSPVLFFILMFSLGPFYEGGASCRTVFIEYPTLGLLGDFYSVYYFGYIFATAVIFYYASRNARLPEKRLLDMGMLSMFIFTVPTFVFLQFLPMFNTQFPSVLCEFALFVALLFIVMIWYKEKHKINY